MKYITKYRLIVYVLLIVFTSIIVIFRFLDYDKNDPRENLRLGRGVEYLRYKEVYYSIELNSIKDIYIDKDVYVIDLGDNKILFDDEELFNLLDKYKLDDYGVKEQLN